MATSLQLRFWFVYYIKTSKYTNASSVNGYDFSMNGGGMCAKRHESGTAYR